MIAIVHAYSRVNWGDSLLTDLARERVEAAGVGRGEYELFALDAPSFSDWTVVHQVGTPARGFSSDMPRALLQLTRSGLSHVSQERFRPSAALERLARAEAAVAVGGGYLRGPDPTAVLGCLVNHVPQLAEVARGSMPSVYLPQSIGPFRKRLGKRVLGYLSSVDRVFLRDDVSMAEIGSRPNVSRCPDLVVLQIAESFGSRTEMDRTDEIVLVARELGLGAEYLARLRELGRLTGGTWAAQAEGIGSKSDSNFYAKAGIEGRGTVAEALGGHPSVVVSVRLHGALQSVLAGVPAIHLSYDRKGPSAYEDLGLQEFVHDVRSFDPRVVAEQALSLRADPGRFWAPISERLGSLLESSKNLTRVVAQTIG